MQNRTVSDKRGNTVVLCNFHFTDHEGKEERCNAPAACPVCGACSRLDGEHERGHCPGHAGLNQFIAVPGNDAFAKLKKEKR